MDVSSVIEVVAYICVLYASFYAVGVLLIEADRGASQGLHAFSSSYVCSDCGRSKERCGGC